MEENKVVNIEDYKTEEIARGLVEATNLMENEDVKASLFEARDIIKSNTGLDIPEEVLLEIGALFALEDEQFSIIADEFLNGFERSLSSPADRIALAQSLNTVNLKQEDIIAAYEQWNVAIDNALGDMLSNIKRDFLKRTFGIVVNSVMENEGIAKRIINVPVVLSEGAIMPVYANIGDAGADICALEETVINPGETKIIPTGIKVEIPIGYEIQVRPRSGLSAKSKLRIANAPGTIDSKYRDEIGIICENIEPKIKDIDFEYNEDGSMNIKSVEFGSSITIEKGQRIAQLVLSEVPTMKFVPVTELDNTDNRNGGFGSTGK